MRAVTEDEVRASFVNVTKSERTAIVMPELETLDWDKLNFLGWRDRKQPLVGYVVAVVDGGLLGVMLRQAETKPQSRALCSWCTDVTLPNDVVLFAAKRAGDAGRKGDTVGTLACDAMQCSRNVRKLPPLAYPGFDREAARLERIAALSTHVEGFVRDVAGR